MALPKKNSEPNIKSCKQINQQLDWFEDENSIFLKIFYTNGLYYNSYEAASYADGQRIVAALL
jgi:hypothetical protein